MTTFVLIPGAGGNAWYWHLLVDELTDRGHDAVAVDLPADDDTAGLAEYADVVVEAIGDRTDLVLVAQSMAGFTAPLVCDRVRVDLLVLLTAMIPLPGESPGEWWANTGHDRAMAEQSARDGTPSSLDTAEDLEAIFFHDVPPDITAEAMQGGRDQSGTPFEKPWPLDALARRAHEVPAVSRRPVLPGRVHAPGRPRTPGHHAGRDRRRSPRRPQPAEGTGRSAGEVPHRGEWPVTESGFTVEGWSGCTTAWPGTSRRARCRGSSPSSPATTETGMTCTST